MQILKFVFFKINFLELRKVTLSVLSKQNLSGLITMINIIVKKKRIEDTVIALLWFVLECETDCFVMASMTVSK